MTGLFADRMGCVHRSFVREILKVTEDPEIISVAGGLPNPRYAPGVRLGWVCACEEIMEKLIEKYRAQTPVFRPE